MIPPVTSRRITAIASMILAMQWLIPVPDARTAERSSSTEEQRSQVGPGTERYSGVIPISANVAHNLERIEKPAPSPEIYDLFSGPGQSSSAERLKGKRVGKDSAQTAQPSRTSAVPVSTEPTPVAVLPDPSIQPPLPPSQPEVVILPPPEVVALPPQPPPKPPAMPFVYMGKLTESGRTVYFLVKGDKLYTVSPGEEIDGSYLLEGEVGNQIKLTYKPLHVAQTLTMMGP